jgi:hypothetical protein
MSAYRDDADNDGIAIVFPMPDPADISGKLAGVLAAAASPTGGWGYYPGKFSRIEPTCWSLLATDSGTTVPGQPGIHERFLTACQRSGGLLSDRNDLPVNLTWSALALLTLTCTTPQPTEVFRRQLIQAITKTAGVQVRNNPLMRQDNGLKGWPWMPETFSWAEPTSWCLLALKQASRGLPDLASKLTDRIAEGEAMLMDRACESGGWNYGNANVLGKNLPAHVPTTALGLLALQDKHENPVVQRGLAFLDSHWESESSGTALALTLICLRIYGRPTVELESALVRQWERTRFLGNVATTAMADCALDRQSSALIALSLPA